MVEGTGLNPLPYSNSQPKPHFTSQSVQAPGVNSLPLDDMCRVATVVQQIMTELNV